MTDALVVFAAGSLRPVFGGASEPLDGWSGGPVSFRFANARVLADAIEQGYRADVFASASATDPDRLHAAGILSRPLAFARNQVVIAVPRTRAEEIRSVGDLAASGVRVVVEVAGVPLGEYTRAALRRLEPPDLADRILANVVSQELDVQAVAKRLTEGFADAGFLYRTDVLAADRLAAIELPPEAQVEATYMVGVVRGADREDEARSWVRWLLGPGGQRTLAAAGFGPPPPAA